MKPKDEIPDMDTIAMTIQEFATHVLKQVNVNSVNINSLNQGQVAIAEALIKMEKLVRVQSEEITRLERLLYDRTTDDMTRPINDDKTTTN